jgi:hypothetical protein
MASTVPAVTPEKERVEGGKVLEHGETTLPENVPERRLVGTDSCQELTMNDADAGSENTALVLEEVGVSGMMSATRASGGMADASDLKSTTPLSQEQAPSRRYANPASALTSNLALSDPNLAAVIDAWPKLSEPLRAGILAMVKATTGKG